MRIVFLFFLITISEVVNGQSVIKFNNGNLLTVYPYWKTKDVLYFKTSPKADTAYFTSLSQLSHVTSGIVEIKPVVPELYIEKFRRGQLTGLGLNLLGGIITSVGVAISKDKTSPVVYGGAGIFVIGFIVSITSFDNLKKYYVIKSAQPYIAKN